VGVITERLDSIGKLAPLPNGIAKLLYLDPATATVVLAHCQAWPLLRAEMLDTEATNARLVAANAALVAERDEFAARDRDRQRQLTIATDTLDLSRAMVTATNKKLAALGTLAAAHEQLKVERDHLAELVAAADAAGRELVHRRERDDLAAELDRSRREVSELHAALDSTFAHNVAAEKLALSVDLHNHQGGRVPAFIDGAAFDAWRRTQ
jgi:hypothetical protein